MPRFAFGGVVSIAVVAAVILGVRAGRYDWFGDELYFVAAGHRLAVSYVDQGPLVPVVARLLDAAAPGSRTVLRLPAVAMGVVTILVSAALAREFGGGRRAQVLAAVGAAGCPFLLTQSASLSTFAFDATSAGILLWCVVHRVRVRRDGALVAAAVTVAIAFQVKPLVPVVVAGIVSGLIVFGPRSVPRWSPVAALAVLMTALPAILWQARHGWPQLAMGAVIRSEQRDAMGGPAWLPLQLVLLAGPLGTVLLVAGVVALTRAPAVREYRFLLVAGAVLVAFVVVAGGRPYYLAGLFPAFFAAGAVGLVAMRPIVRIGGAVLGALSLVLTVTLIFALPVPTATRHDPVRTPREMSTRLRLTGTTGWERLVETTERAYREVEPAERERTVLVAENYWQAAALDRLADLPAVYSPNRGFAAFGAPPDSATTVLYVTAGPPGARWNTLFPSAVAVARLDDPLGFPGITRAVTVWRCARPDRGWDFAWQTLSTNTFDVDR